MAVDLQTLSSNEFLNLIFTETISATPSTTTHQASSTSFSNNFFLHHIFKPQQNHPHETTTAHAAAHDNDKDNPLINRSFSSVMDDYQKEMWQRLSPETGGRRQNLAAVQGRNNGKKRKRKERVCKNKEEAETQRMTHIAVERNRRKLMNEHLSALKSLMPPSYVQRGDQASIVGGAIEFVKELEHLLQTLEAQKYQLLHEIVLKEPTKNNGDANANTNTNTKFLPIINTPFAQFFVHPQYMTNNWSQMTSKCTSKTKAAAIADIEVTLIETHASLRILSRRSPRQLSKLVFGFQTLCLSILHINLTALDHLVLYSISAKLEEGCQLTSVDDIAGAVHHMLRLIIEEEAA